MLEKLNPWQPTTDKLALKKLGKLAEEAGELSAVLSRCIIQGIEESEPVTGKPNREWLEDEIADVYANLGIVTTHFDLDYDRIFQRIVEKQNRLTTWHEME